jgi:hypothetical protein
VHCACVQTYGGVLAYGFDVDPGMPDFIKKTTQLFVLDSGDVSVTQEPHADGHTCYSTSDDSRASTLAKDAHLAGGIGPFSAAASMKVSKDSSSEIKTARLDVTRWLNKERVTARGAFQTKPHTKLDPAYVAYIHDTDIANVEQISSTLGIFYAQASNKGGLIRKSYTMQTTQEDTQSSLEAELTAQYGGSNLIYSASGGASFGETHTSRSNGAAMSMSFHAEGGDTSVWLEPGEDLGAIQTEWAHSFDDGYPTYPWGVELRPIWEVVQKIDQAKGDALKTALQARWRAESAEFHPTQFFTPPPPLVKGYERSYTISGCYNPAHCGTFVQTTFSCAEAPVYQIGSSGPVLYRQVIPNFGAQPGGLAIGLAIPTLTLDVYWLVGPSSANCSDLGIYLRSAKVKDHLGTTVYATFLAAKHPNDWAAHQLGPLPPSLSAFSDGYGWEDIDNDSCYTQCGYFGSDCCGIRCV